MIRRLGAGLGGVLLLLALGACGDAGTTTPAPPAPGPGPSPQPPDGLVPRGIALEPRPWLGAPVRIPAGSRTVMLARLTGDQVLAKYAVTARTDTPGALRVSAPPGATLEWDYERVAVRVEALAGDGGDRAGRVWVEAAPEAGSSTLAGSAVLSSSVEVAVSGRPAPNCDSLEIEARQALRRSPTEWEDGFRSCSAGDCRGRSAIRLSLLAADPDASVSFSAPYNNSERAWPASLDERPANPHLLAFPTRFDAGSGSGVRQSLDLLWFPGADLYDPRSVQGVTFSGSADLRLRLSAPGCAPLELVCRNDSDCEVNRPGERPAVSGLSFASRPRSGGAYGAGETIGVDVAFDQSVTVSGSPTLGLTLGQVVRRAAFEPALSADRRLRFQYAVASTDRDPDGVSIGSGALAAAGGSIRDSSGADADLDLTDHTVPDDPAHRVDGSLRSAPAVTGVSFTSSPRTGATYAASETVAVSVWFGAPVTVSGSPSLALTIGSNRRRAAYRGCGGRRPADPASSCRELQFAYEVQAGDRDLDGIGVGRDALTANGAEIRDAANPGVAAVLSIGAAAVTNDPAQRVDGAGGLPRVFGVRLLGPERGGDTHRAEGVIYVLVSLTESVQVSHGADLTLAIEIGSTIRHARLVMPGEVLDFRYTVQPGDYDPDGISIRADALTIRAGGYARDSDGNDLDPTIPPNAVIVNDPGNKVDGSR